MLGLQGNTSSPKVYRCMACSETFNGLASLLVHQATHADLPSKVSTPPPTQSSDSPEEMLFPHEVSPSGNLSPPAEQQESPSLSFYICDCGEEFQEFGLMLEHKRSHCSEMQKAQPLDDIASLSGGAGSDNDFSSRQPSFSPITQTGSDLSCPSTSKFPDAEVSTLNSLSKDVALEDHVAMVTPPFGQCSPHQDVSLEQIESMSTTAEHTPESEEEDLHLKENIDFIHDETEKNLPNNNFLMKLLASAYTNHISPPLSDSDSDKVVPKQEAIPVKVMGAASSESSVNDLSIAQLRRLLAKPNMKTKAPSISRILMTSRKRVVSLTKTLSPVVVLETRQKLVDQTGKGSYGIFQCGRCRRVFQNVDRLTEHHFLHKKERIKCCRRCKQLIIGRVPLPDNHVCPQMVKKSAQSGSLLKNKSPFASKKGAFHSINNAKKVFFCPVCKNSYARRWNLKTHRCHGPASLRPQQAKMSFQGMFAPRSNSHNETGKDEHGNECNISKSVDVGTDTIRCIKVEMKSNPEPSSVSQLAWTHPAKRFPPFTSPSMMEQHQDPALAAFMEEDKKGWCLEGGENDNEGKWTMPLDDENQMFSSVDVDDDELQSGSAEDTNMASLPPLPYFVSNGVRRYPCNRCHKTYARSSTLRRHLRLCGFRPRGFGSVPQSQSLGAISLNAGVAKPMFPCYVCGKSFSRKDNMMTHRRKCQLQRTMSSVEKVTVQESLATNAATDGQTQEDETLNWGIMSLPSVLPRRVTCECGAGFTSPRLLLEHLQKHAQESYTCPTCGETVNSWADYEVHLQIHMHPHHQMMKGLQPQRLQPLLVRVQRSQQQQQASLNVRQPPQKRPEQQPHLHPHPIKKGQRIVCSRCGNTFSSRCSLRRHLSWNRCKGVRPQTPVTNAPKSYRCSHCNSDFPNSISLIFHQRSGACKPAIKPVRCPVCLRWFGTVEGLQKHLLTHKKSEMYRCDVCQGTYPSLKSLKNHRRRIHRIMAGDMQPKTQEEMTT